MLPRLAKKMHAVHASLHDNTYKRTFGKWNEWEVVIWDSRLNTRITVARIYCDFETTDAFEQIWTAFFEVLEEVTGQPLKIKVIHGEGNYFAFLVDGDAAQAVGLARTLSKMYTPQVSVLAPDDPRDILPHVLKTCWTHCSKNLDILGRQLDNPRDVKYLRSFEHMRTEAEIEQFKAWCQNHPVKGVRDWFENKLRHRWYLPSLNQHLSKMPKEHWMLTPRNTNHGESAHAHTNFYTGTRLPLVVAIEQAYAYDLKREEEMLAAEEHCLFREPWNTLAHRMQRNATRAASRLKKVQKCTADDEQSRELEDIKVQQSTELLFRKGSTITPEERKASMERTKLLKTRETALREAGIQLARGRKPGKPGNNKGMGPSSLPGPSTIPGNDVYAPSNTIQLPNTFSALTSQSLFTDRPTAASLKLPYSLGFDLSPELEPVLGDWSVVDEFELEQDKLTLEPQWHY